MWGVLVFHFFHFWESLKKFLRDLSPILTLSNPSILEVNRRFKDFNTLPKPWKNLVLNILFLFYFSHICILLTCNWHVGTSWVAQMIKNLPTMQETRVLSLGWKDPLEKGMITHSSILAWRISMDRGAWQATVHGVTKNWTWLSDHHFHF